VTTFIDFRYSRTLAAALFTGEETEEVEIRAVPGRENYVALDIERAELPATLCRLSDSDGKQLLVVRATAESVSAVPASGDTVSVARAGGKSSILCIMVSGSRLGLRCGGQAVEIAADILANQAGVLECSEGVRVLGQGTGRAERWAELLYHRNEPAGLCVQLTMDWHHLRAGIPLFGTMTAEELVAAGEYRLRFKSYAYEASEAESTDFVKMFGCEDPPDIAVHLTPALYDTRVEGIPNLGFAVIETDDVHPYLVERCNRMDRICVPSSYARETFTRNGVTRPIDVVLHGVDTEYFRPPRQKVSLPQGRGFNFLAVATFVERKNIEYLVRAFLEEFRASEDVALFLLLRPEYHTTQNNVALEFTEWERTWDSDSAPVLLWTGYLTREHLRDFYANADAYAMPSNEGFGLTLLEAMACGTPAIGLDHGGVKDFLDSHNGRLVRKGKSYTATDVDTLPYVGDVFHAPDIRDLRRALRRMFEDRAATRELGERARSTAEALSWQRVTEWFSGSIAATHSEFHAGNAGSSPIPPAPSITLVLRVMDDIDVRDTLDHLATLRGVRVLCLFTRYARLADIERARRYGFVYYRWDGSDSNARVIARSVMGNGQIILLNPGDRIDGDPSRHPGLTANPPETRDRPE
jgi:glycosyltransferase involved in cell wall biosynthesis